MKRFAQLLAFLCGIPLLGIVVGFGLEWHFEHQWSTQIERAVANGRQDMVRLQSVKLSEICRRSSFNLSPALRERCSDLHDLGTLKSASTATLIAGPGLIGLIALAARLARGRRRLLAALFSPGLRVVVIGLFLFILAQAAIAFFALIFAETELAGSVHSFTILVALGGLIGAGLILWHGLRLAKRATTSAVAVLSTPERHPRLHALIAEIARKVGATPPRNTILGIEPTFYATAADVVLIGDRATCTGETLYLSLPLLRLFTVGELTAVIGHELAHFAGEDAAYTMKFYPIFRGSHAALDAVVRHGQRGAMGLTMLPAVVVLDFFIKQFTHAEREIGRQREFAADKAGAAAASAEDLAHSLLKVGAATDGVWRSLRQQMIGALNSGKVFVNVSKMFAEMATGFRIDPKDINREITHPTDTHPPTSARLAELGLATETMIATLTMPPVAEAATMLFDDLEEIEKFLSGREHERLLAYGLATLPKATDSVKVDGSARDDAGAPS
jgi:Zn-dependent protease with chaperone function